MDFKTQEFILPLLSPRLPHVVLALSPQIGSPTKLEAWPTELQSYRKDSSPTPPPVRKAPAKGVGWVMSPSWTNLLSPSHNTPMAGKVGCCECQPPPDVPGLRWEGRVRYLEAWIQVLQGNWEPAPRVYGTFHFCSSLSQSDVVPSFKLSSYHYCYLSMWPQFRPSP